MNKNTNDGRDLQENDRWMAYIQMVSKVENKKVQPYQRKCLLLTTTLKAFAYVNELPVNCKKFGIAYNPIEKREDIQLLLKNLSFATICGGVQIDNDKIGDVLNAVKCRRLFKDCAGLWRHESCQLVLTNGMQCLPCKKIQSIVLKRISGGKISSEVKIISSLCRKIKSTRRQNTKTRRRLTCLQKQLFLANVNLVNSSKKSL